MEKETNRLIKKLNAIETDILSITEENEALKQENRRLNDEVLKAIDCLVASFNDFRNNFGHNITEIHKMVGGSIIDDYKDQLIEDIKEMKIINKTTPLDEKFANDCTINNYDQGQTETFDLVIGYLNR